RSDRDRSTRAGNGRPASAEERPAGLVPREDCERCQDSRLVEDRPSRVDTRNLGDEREKTVPQRERIARVEPSVGELVDPMQRQVAERSELADTSEMEEPV